jgi:ribosomal-protein-alanine N-acetyltransferase
MSYPSSQQMADALLLETPRLRLRPCTAADLGDLHSLWTDPQVRRWLWDDRAIGRSLAGQVVGASEASFAARGFGQWMVHERAGAVFVGFAGLRALEAESEIELLFGLWPRFQGRGYATEACRAVLSHAFGSLALPRVLARTDVPNRASARVLERLGMRFEGERALNGQPTLHYGMSKAEFERPKPERLALALPRTPP